MGRLIHEKLSREIIGTAVHVLNEMRPGLDEKLYERAMVIALQKRGHAIASQKEFPVSYDGELVGNLVLDLIADEKVIVDPKVVAAFNEAHVAQMVGYLTITALELALFAELQGCALGMEARGVTAKRRIGNSRPSCLATLRDIRVIRGFKYGFE